MPWYADCLSKPYCVLDVELSVHKGLAGMESRFSNYAVSFIFILQKGCQGIFAGCNCRKTAARPVTVKGFKG